MALSYEDIFRLLLAFALGGMIGAEREFRDKAAGLRTIMFISTGSALFTIFSTHLAPGLQLSGDPARIAAQIVTGVGFLGAGAIMREGGEIRGLTTAATIWLAAALGMGAGMGLYLFSTLATAIILLALLFFPSLEHMMGRYSQVHEYQVTISSSLERYEAFLRLFDDHHLRIISKRRKRIAGDLHLTLVVAGRPANHSRLSDFLFQDPEIKSIEV
jgi:putative Mg2+ transporter-C (MgtC) family protein